MSCVGRFGLAAVLDRDVVTNQQLHGFVVPTGLDPRYLAYVIKAQRQFLEASATSTTILYLNKTRCESIPLPLPPIKEQKRIVANVDQLMSLCGELEERQQKRRESCVRINNGAIAQLLTTHEPDAFTKHWQRIYDTSTYFTAFLKISANSAKLFSNLLSKVSLYRKTQMMSQHLYCWRRLRLKKSG